MEPTKEPPRSPPWWVRQLYRCLAAGRYSAQWLPELLHLYDEMVMEEGEQAAFDWMLEELKLSLAPSAAVRVLPFLRFAHRVWKTYRRVAGS
jgi:hypothetical protein